jgi:hypothetical protein
MRAIIVEPKNAPKQHIIINLPALEARSTNPPSFLLKEKKK